MRDISNDALGPVFDTSPMTENELRAMEKFATYSPDSPQFQGLEGLAERLKANANAAIALRIVNGQKIILVDSCSEFALTPPPILPEATFSLKDSGLPPSAWAGQQQAIKHANRNRKKQW